jgi:hypothetical protein
MVMRSIYLMGLGLLACAVSGCETTATPRLDSSFGDSVNAAKAQQTIYPEAPRNPDPVAGLGGTPAKDSVDRYHNTFKEPPPTFTIINVGGGR